MLPVSVFILFVMVPAIAAVEQWRGCPARAGDARPIAHPRIMAIIFVTVAFCDTYLWFLLFPGSPLDYLLSTMNSLG